MWERGRKRGGSGWNETTQISMATPGILINRWGAILWDGNNKDAHSKKEKRRGQDFPKRKDVDTEGVTTRSKHKTNRGGSKSVIEGNNEKTHGKSEMRGVIG